MRVTAGPSRYPALLGSPRWPLDPPMTPQDRAKMAKIVARSLLEAPQIVSTPPKIALRSPKSGARATKSGQEGSWNDLGAILRHFGAILA